VDDEDDVLFSDSFSRWEDEICRHPAVEITYTRGQNWIRGYLRVHVVWAEYVDCGLVGFNWNIYYRYIQFNTNSAGINWTPDVDSTVPLFDTSADEIEPDIGIHPDLNYLYVIYLLYDSGNSDLIKAALHSDMSNPGDWGDQYRVCGTNSRDKFAPRIDAGFFTPSCEDSSLTGYVGAVWCEAFANNDYDDWQIFYNSWQPDESADTGDVVQVTDGSSVDEINILPQLDITPRSSQINEAVFTWVNATYNDQSEEFEDFQVQITATPYVVDSVYNVAPSDYSRGADMACYQRADEDMVDDEEWIAVSYYSTDDEGGHWTAGASSLSFYIDEQQDEVQFSAKHSASTGLYGQWSESQPFTGSTLCLRDPYHDVDGNGEPKDEIFGLGWIEEDDDVMLTDGEIH